MMNAQVPNHHNDSQRLYNPFRNGSLLQNLFLPPYTEAEVKEMKAAFDLIDPDGQGGPVTAFLDGFTQAVFRLHRKIYGGFVVEM